MHSTRTFPFGKVIAQGADGWVLAESTPDRAGNTILGLWWRGDGKGAGFPHAFGHPAWFNVPEAIEKLLRPFLPLLACAYPPDARSESA